jgi:hypothetical protein
LHVRYQEDSCQRGVLTLQKLEEEVLASDAVFHIVGRQSGSIPPQNQVEAFLKRHPDFTARFPEVAAASATLTYTQWESWLALFFEKRLCVYKVTDGSAEPAAETGPMQASQQAHEERLRKHKVYGQCAKDLSALLEEIRVSLIDLHLLTQDHPLGPADKPLIKGSESPVAATVDDVFALKNGSPLFAACCPICGDPQYHPYVGNQPTWFKCVGCNRVPICRRHRAPGEHLCPDCLKRQTDSKASGLGPNGVVPFPPVNKKLAERIISAKLKHDFERSPLSSGPKKVEKSYLEAVCQLVRAGLVRKSALSQDLLVSIPSVCWRSFPPPEVIGRLREHGRIEVNCACISVGCIAALKRLAKEFHLDLTIDFRDIRGRQQLQSLAEAAGRIDFIIVPNGAFAFHAKTLGKGYLFRMPVFVERQYKYKRKGAQRIWEKLVYPESSAAEQHQYEWRYLSNRTPARPVEYDDLVAQTNELDPRQEIIVWEPVDYFLKYNPMLQRTGRYHVWHGLYCHQRWQANAELRNCFEAAFVSAWVYCGSNQRYAKDLLMQDELYLTYLLIGSGRSH